ncbi:hypothetical protein HDV02_004825, partial [Globomyces sp. JEL0801]
VYKFYCLIKGDRSKKYNNITVTENQDSEETPEHKKPWPPIVVERMKRMLSPVDSDIVNEDGIAHSETFQCEWINLLVCRMFLALRSSSVFRKLWSDKMSSKMNAKLVGNSFVSHIQIQNLLLGDDAPTIEGLRCLKGVSNDLAVMTEFDIIYRGGASIVIECTLANGNVIPVQVFMNAFRGTLRTRLPSEKWLDMIGFAFVKDPGVSFKVDTPITLGENEMLRGMINKVLSTIMRKLFLDLWVLPSWRTQFLPFLEPKLEDMEVRNRSSSRVKEGGKKVKNSIATRATQLWESSVTKKPLNLAKDALEGYVFDTNCTIPLAGLDTTDLYERPLVNSFIALVTEPGVNLYATNLKRKLSSLSLRSKKTDGSVDQGETVDVEDEEHTTITEENKQEGKSETSPAWKLIKNKSGIFIERKVVDNDEGESVTQINRGTMPIACDPIRVFNILSNPAHFQQMYEHFTDVNVLYEEGNHTIHRCQFQFTKGTTSGFQVFQTKSKPISSSNDSKTSAQYVVMRSVGNFKTASKPAGEESGVEVEVGSVDIQMEEIEGSELRLRGKKNIRSDQNNTLPDLKGKEPLVENEGQVFIFGYYVVAGDTPQSSTVTIMSQFSNDLHRLEVDYTVCRKLKQFIEELVQHTDINFDSSHPKSSEESGPRRRIFSSGEDASKVGAKLLHVRNGENMGSEDELPDVQTRTSTPDSLLVANPDPSAEEGSPLHLSDSHSSLVSEFGASTFIERVVSARDVLTVEFDFNRHDFGDHVLLKWEYVSRSEQTGNFAIHYSPHDERGTDISRMLPFAGQGVRAVFPSSRVQCYSTPSYGSIAISGFESGKFLLIWDNSSSFSGRTPKQITYRCIIQNSLSFPELHAQVEIQRKASFSLPFIYDSSIGRVDKEGNALPMTLECSYSTVGTAIPFALYFDPLKKSTEANESGNISSRLAGVVSGENSPNLSRSFTPRKTIIPFQRNANRTPAVDVHHSIPVSNMFGVYTLVWDNSASIVSTKQLNYHVTFKLAEPEVF